MNQVSYCSVHDTYPEAGEPCWACANPFIQKAYEEGVNSAQQNMNLAEENFQDNNQGNTKNKLHCRVCGTALKVVVKSAGYNQDGEKNYHIFYQCPNYSFPFRLNHDRLVESEDYWGGTPKDVPESDLSLYDY